MKRNIITISREFGSGGRTIARKLAEQLGIPYYDRELIAKIAEESGYNEEIVAEEAEDAPTKNRFVYTFIDRDVCGMSTSDYLWRAQVKVIRELADKGPCVIVGRCADYILRERDDCFNVFIHASIPFRAERIVARYGKTQTDPEKRLRDKDRTRSIHYNYYTDRTWGVADNYDLTLNSGTLGIDKCVEIIKSLV